MMKGNILLLVLPVLLSACASAGRKPDYQTVATEGGRWDLVWDEEFDRDGLPDAAKWSFDTVGNATRWGNDELQYYTAADTSNAVVRDGALVITAKTGSVRDFRYTSARLTTAGKGDWCYGRFEIRAKIPVGVGTWPAIWMMPTDKAYGSWPASGEIDIMENVGFAPDSIVGTVHTQSFNHVLGTQKTSYLKVPTAHSEFHVYALEWKEDACRLFVDDFCYFTYRNRGLGFAEWPFDQRFHLILNLAVGGNWGGRKGVDDAVFPHRYYIDYVRVYKEAE